VSVKRDCRDFELFVYKNWQSSAVRVNKQHLLLPHHISLHNCCHVNAMFAVRIDGLTLVFHNQMVIPLAPDIEPVLSRSKAGESLELVLQFG
jgi:hypothetical protein